MIRRYLSELLFLNVRFTRLSPFIRKLINEKEVITMRRIIISLMLVSAMFGTALLQEAKAEPALSSSSIAKKKATVKKTKKKAVTAVSNSMK